MRDLPPPALAAGWVGDLKKLADPKQRELARTLYDGRQTDIATICATLGISRATLYRALKHRDETPGATSEAHRLGHNPP